MQECEDGKFGLELGSGYMIYWAYMTLLLDDTRRSSNLLEHQDFFGLGFLPKIESLKCARWSLKMLIHKRCGGRARGIWVCRWVSGFR